MSLLQRKSHFLMSYNCIFLILLGKILRIHLQAACLIMSRVFSKDNISETYRKFIPELKRGVQILFEQRKHLQYSQCEPRG